MKTNVRQYALTAFAAASVFLTGCQSLPSNWNNQVRGSIDSQLVNAVLNKPLEIDTLSEIVRECAHVIPLPPDPLPCSSPAESEVRDRFDRGGSTLSN